MTDFTFSSLAQADDSYDVVIVGGGIIGVALACGLARAQHRVLVLEANPGWCKRLAGELLHPAAVDVLRDLGLLEPIKAAGASPVGGFAVYPAKGDGDETVLYYAEIGDGRRFGYGVDHETLVNTLRERAAAHDGLQLCGGKVAELVVQGGRVVGVVASDKSGQQRTIAARLVVAADGRQSSLRKMLGLDPGHTLISYSAGTIVPDSALPHAGMGHIFLGAWGPTLAYPMGNGNARIIFDLPPDFSNGRRDRLAAHLAETYLPHLSPKLREAVQATLEDPNTLQLTPNYRVQARACWAPGAALVGDASGCMHPMTASGMTNGLNDVRVLVPLATAYLRAPHDNRPLQRYDALRRPFFQTRALLSRALHEVFRSPSPGAQALRRGVFERWRTHRGFRLRTIGLLAGTESNPVVFATQYFSVVRLAARKVLGQHPAQEGLRTLVDIGRQSMAHIDRNAISDLLPVPSVRPATKRAA